MRFLALFLAALLSVGAADARPRGIRAVDTGGFNGGRTQLHTNFLSFTGEFGYLNLVKTGQAWSWINTSVPPGAPGPDMLTSNGYPIFQTTYNGTACGVGGICNGGIRTVTEIPGVSERSLSYVLVTTGTGTVRATGLSSTVVTGTKTQTAFTASPSFNPVNGSVGYWTINVDILATDVSDPITELALVHVDDATGNDLTNYLTKAGTAEGRFGTKFLARLREANPGVIRFMNWQNANASNVTKWADRTPVDYVIFGGYTYNSSYYAVATNSGNDYSVTLGSGAPADKQTVHALFQGTAPAVKKDATITNGNCSIAVTAHGYSLNEPVGLMQGTGNGLALPFTDTFNYYVVSVPDADHVTISTTVGGACITPTQSTTSQILRQPTLNFNGTGAIAIKNAFATTLNATGNTEVPQNGRIGTLVYDADLNAWMMQGGNSGTGLFNQGIVNGFPIEDGVLLCTYIRCHPWFVQPHFTAGPSAGAAYSDWLPGLVNYLKANAPAWMIPRIEPVSNEVWNGQFFSTGYANAKASAMWGGPTSPNKNDYHNFYGYAASLAGQVINANFGGSVPRDNSRYWVVIGVQQVSSPTSNDARLTSAKFLSLGPAPPAGLATSAAYNWVTHEAPANYYGVSLGAAAQVANAYSYAQGDASQLTAYVASTAVANAPALGPIPTKVASFLDHYNWGMGLGAYTGKPWALAGIAIGQTAYEGGWSPPYPTSVDISTSQSNATSPATSISKAANAVLNLATTSNPWSSGPTTGNGAVVGMPVRIINAAGGDFTKLNGARATITYTNGSSDITQVAHGYLVGQSAAFTVSNGTMTASLSGTQVYCIVATPTADTFRVATTCVGSPIVISTAGISGTQQVTTGWYVTGVGGGLGANNVSINADTSAYVGTYTASSASVVYMSNNFDTRNIMVASLNEANMGTYLASFYAQLIANGCQFPSQFDVGGTNFPWTPLSPTIYEAPDPSYWTAIKTFNAP